MKNQKIIAIGLSLGLIFSAINSVIAETADKMDESEIITENGTTLLYTISTPTPTPTYTPTPTSPAELNCNTSVNVVPGTVTTGGKHRADCTTADYEAMYTSGMGSSEIIEVLEITYQKGKNIKDIISEVKNSGIRISSEELRKVLEKYPDQESEDEKSNKEAYKNMRSIIKTTNSPLIATPTSVPTPEIPQKTGNEIENSDVSVQEEMTFRDVTKEDWYFKAISFISLKSITMGDSDGNFNPNSNLTRGECLVMLMKAYNISPDVNPTENFYDAGDTFYTSYLSSAKRLGITNGVGNNMFCPNKGITRQELFVFIYNTLKELNKLPTGQSGRTLESFKDSKGVAVWATDSMELFIKSGIIVGSKNEILPNSITTRAQMAQILFNLLKE